MRCTSIAFLVLLLVSPARSHAPPPPPEAATPAPAGDAPGNAVAELGEFNQRLGELQDRAMRDSQIVREYGALQEIVSEAMEEIDSGTASRRARLLRIVDLLSEAQAAEDDATSAVLAEEGAGLEPELRSTPQAAFAHDSVAPRLLEFQATLMAKMTEIDPATPELVDRAGELMERLP
jgi:hypothetical protein